MAQQQIPAIHLCLINPPGYLHGDALLDPAQYFYWQFTRLGQKVTLARNLLRHDAVNFVFGAHLGFDARLLHTHSCIIVNLEQTGQGGARLDPDYLRLLRAAVVVDYNPHNPPAYTDHPEDVPLVSFGHAGWMKPGPYDALPLEKRPLDLLFIGSVNKRRQELLERIQATGRTVHLQARPIYGAARNSLVLQARGLLNLHFYDTARFEQVRAFMSLSLGTPVLSERLPNTSAGPVFDTCVTWFEDGQLEPLFAQEFDTDLYFDVSRQQLEIFRTVDPIAEYADLVGFAKGVWQAQRDTMLACDDQDRCIGPRMPLPWGPDVPRHVMVVSPDTVTSAEETSGQEKQAAPRPDGLQANDCRHDASRPAPLFQMMPDLCFEIDQMLAEDQPGLALLTMVQRVTDHFLQPGMIEYGLYYPALDARILKLAERLKQERQAAGRLRPARPASKASTCTLLIASDVYENTGGHSRVLEDLVNHLPNPVLVLTNLFGRIGDVEAEMKQWMRRCFARARVIVLDPGTLWQKAHQLAERCEHHQPASVWYMTHQQDPVAFAGSLAYDAPHVRRYFVHHADHTPALGCTLPDIHHVDLTTSLQQRCSCALHIQSSWLPLYVRDQGARAPLPVSDEKPFSVVTAGREGKFVQTGPLALKHIVAAVLKKIDGRFHHIGKLDEHTIGLIRAHLREQGIDPARWVWHGQVPSLWQTLKTLDAHAYIGSAPMSGGRGAVEAHGCGYPVLPFNGFHEDSLLADYSSYADLDLAWQNIPELLARLGTLKPRVEEASQRARQFYEQCFSQHVFVKKLKELNQGESLGA